MKAALEDMPGMRMSFLQPIEMRVNEMIAGVRSDVGIKVFGDDLDVLKATAREVEAVVRRDPRRRRRHRGAGHRTAGAPGHRGPRRHRPVRHRRA